MIVSMKHLTLLCVAADGERALERLRSLGVAHLDLGSAASPALAAAKGDRDDAERAVNVICAAKAASVESELSSLPAAELVPAVIRMDDERLSLEERISRISDQIASYEPFGDFDPELVRGLAAKGLEVSLVKVSAKAAEEPEGALVSRLGVSSRAVCYAVVGATRIPEGAETVKLPEERLSAMQARRDEMSARVGEIAGSIAALQPRVAEIEALCPGLADRVSFAAAEALLKQQGEVAYVEGWVPADAEQQVKETAAAECWGILVRDPAEGENPPTLVRPPRIFAPVVALFKGLGIAPAYTESDVSIPFMCYFSIFFAMLIGDGGYGSLILLGTLFAWFKAKNKKAFRSWGILLTVFSVCTIAWGVLSNTWFGAQIPFMKSATSEWLGDKTYHTMIFVSITIGVSHLILARVWNFLCTMNRLTCIAQLGWAGILLCMYWITCGILGIFQGPLTAAEIEAMKAADPALAASLTLAPITKMPCWLLPTFGGSILAVLLFGVPVSELKTRGIEIGMLPLNIMSTLGDIISYVRLFAVGLASVKLAENFNNMAVGLVDGEKALWVNAIMAVLMVLVLLIGHGVNMAMGALSILVHAVRLNTLEFSNHKGITWAGYAFNPFRKNAE